MAEFTIPIGVAVTLGLAALGGYVALVKVIASRFERAIDAKFAALSESRKQEQQATATRFEHLADLVEKMRLELHRMQVELPREYTRKEDHVQALATVNAKIDAVQAAQQQLIMMVGALKGRRDD